MFPTMLSRIPVNSQIPVPWRTQEQQQVKGYPQSPKPSHIPLHSRIPAPGGFKAQPVPGFIRKRKEQAKQSLRVLSSTITKPEKKTKVAVGDTVGFTVGGKKRTGSLVFVGNTQFSEGEWCGIVLDEAVGKNDGSVLGVRYFECKNKHGLFLPIDKVKLVKKCSSEKEGDEVNQEVEQSSRRSSVISVESWKEENISQNSECVQLPEGKELSNPVECPLEETNEEEMKTVVTKQISLNVNNRPLTVKIGEGTRLKEDGTSNEVDPEQKSMVVYITGQQRKRPVETRSNYQRSVSLPQTKGNTKPVNSNKESSNVIGQKTQKRSVTYDRVKRTPSYSSLVGNSHPTRNEEHDSKLLKTKSNGRRSSRNGSVSEEVIDAKRTVEDTVSGDQLARKSKEYQGSATVPSTNPPLCKNNVLNHNNFVKPSIKDNFVDKPVVKSVESSVALTPLNQEPVSSKASVSNHVVVKGVFRSNVNSKVASVKPLPVQPSLSNKEDVVAMKDEKISDDVFVEDQVIHRGVDSSDVSKRDEQVISQAQETIQKSKPEKQMESLERSQDRDTKEDTAEFSSRVDYSNIGEPSEQKSISDHANEMEKHVDKENDDVPRALENEWPGEGGVKRAREMFNKPQSRSGQTRGPEMDFWKRRSKSCDSIKVSRCDDNNNNTPKTASSLTNLDDGKKEDVEMTSPSMGRRKSIPVAKRKIASSKLRRDSLKPSLSLDAEKCIGNDDHSTGFSSFSELKRAYSDLEMDTLKEELASVAIEGNPSFSLDDIMGIDRHTDCPRVIQISEIEEDTIQESVPEKEDVSVAEKVDKKSGIPKKTGIPKRASRLPAPTTVANHKGKAKKGPAHDEKIDKKEEKNEVKETEPEAEVSKIPESMEENEMNLEDVDDETGIPRFHRPSVGDIVAKIEKTKPLKVSSGVTKTVNKRDKEKGPNESSMGNKHGSPYARASPGNEELAAKEFLSQKFVDKHTSPKSPHSGTANQNGSALPTKAKTKAKEAGKAAAAGKVPSAKPPKLNRTPSVASDTSSYVSVSERDREKEEETAKAHENLKNQVNYLRNTLTSKHRTLEALAVVIQHYSEKVDQENEKNDEMSKEQVSLLQSVASKENELVDAVKHVETLKDKLAAAQSKHSKDIEDLRCSLRTQHERYIDEVSSEYHEELEHLKETHAEEMRRISTSNQERFGREVKILAEQHSKDMETVVSDYEEKLEELKVQLRCLVEVRDSMSQELAEYQKRREPRSPYPIPDADLPAELESLQAVLEIKKDEIKDLRQQNMEMKKKMEDFHELKREHEKIVHEKEALKMALENKSKFHRQMSVERDNLAASLEEQSRKVMRLSMENEELLWKVAETNLSTSTPALNNNFSPPRLNGPNMSPTSPLPKKLKRLSLNLPTLHDEFPFS